MISKWQNAFRLLLSCLFLLVPITSEPSAGLGHQAASATPLNIAIIFDLSSSASSSNQSPTVRPKDLKSFVSQLFQMNNQNQFSIVGVSTTPTVIISGSADRDATMKALSKLSTKRVGATALYDACHLGIEKVAQGESSKRVLLVVSDGVDTSSDKTSNEVKRALVEKNVKLYAIVGRSKNNVYDGVLDEMASVSGGAAFHYEQSKDIGTILNSLIAKLQE